MIFLHEFILVGEETPIVMVSEGETSRRAAARDLEFVDDFFPKFAAADLDRASPHVDSFV